MIQIAEVSKAFGPVPALDRVSLAVADGERVGFVGANGSGKTTLMRCLLGLLRFEGKISLLGADVSREPEVALRGVAYIPQIAPPIEAPVGEVVRAYLALRGLPAKAVEEPAERLGLAFQPLRDKRFRDLSGGMKQKLLAALALAVRAPVLVADEPTANLDGPARAAFFDALSGEGAPRVVVLCSHRIEEIKRLVDRVVELGDGKLVSDRLLVDLVRDLPSHVVEVSVRADASDAAAFLLKRGFVALGPHRYEARLTQEQKLGVVSDFLRAHEAAVVDLVVSPIEDMSVVLHKVRPVLRAVS